jgi:signal transduction histidine kinase
MRPRTLTLTTALVALAVTIAITTLPLLQFAYYSPGAHVAFETAESLIALLITYLAFGRLRQEALVRDAALVAGFLILGLTNPFFTAVQTFLLNAYTGRFAIWAPLTGRLVAACVLTYAAFAPEKKISDARKATAVVILAALASLAAGSALVSALLPSLPADLGADIAVGHNSPQLEGHASVFFAQVVSAAAWIAASIGFTRHAEESGDVLLRWFGAGSAFAAVAHWNYVVFPTIYEDYVYIGDLTRLGSYAMFLYGASRVIRSYWTGLAEAAVLRERSRLAEELHDGIAQELTFMTSQTRILMKRAPTPLETKRLVGASERAAAETRRAIAALSRTEEQTLSDAIVEVTEELCGRVGSRARFRIDDSIDVDPRTREVLARIVWEAVSNSLRHSGTKVVDVELAPTSNGRFHIRVQDEGTGFDPGAASTGKEGFGLLLMHERARAIGADFNLRSRVEGGTTVELTVQLNGAQRR